MNIIFYIIIFLIGILFGSFYTLAVYRIPKKQDITHTRSYCPNCNHRLEFFDLIPILSYIFLRGKCRYCGKKIRPRYMILEVLSGLLFVTIAYVMKLDIYATHIQLIEYGFMVLYITFIVLIAGIDQENRRIDLRVSIYGVVISIMYMLYLCIVEKTSIYRYGIYILFYIFVFVLDRITLRKYLKSKYATTLLLNIITMVIFTGEYITENSIIFTLLAIAFYLLLYKIKNKRNVNKQKDEHVANKVCAGFFLCTFNLVMLIIVLYIQNYVY